MGAQLLLLTALMAVAVQGAAYNGTASTAAACAKQCNVELDQCQSQSDPNESLCAADYASCLGFNPYGDGTFTSATACASSAPISTASTPAEACANRCNEQLDQCQSQPDPNESTCAAEYAACIGYNPYGGSDFVSATACSTVGAAAVTTHVVDTLTTYCSGPTTLTVNDKTYTVTEATILTITDCPCTITGPPQSGATMPAESQPAASQSMVTQPAGTTPATTTPSAVTGAAASHVVPSFLLIVGAIALL